MVKSTNTPQLPGFSPEEAADFLAGLNCLSIIVELPCAALARPGKPPGVIRLWETTSFFSGRRDFEYDEFDRLARPVANEGLATVTNRRHEHNDHDNPTDDVKGDGLISDIDGFLQFPAGRSLKICGVIESILVPDVMVADLSQSDHASYLGYEVT